MNKAEYSFRVEWCEDNKYPWLHWVGYTRLGTNFSFSHLSMTAGHRGKWLATTKK